MQLKANLQQYKFYYAIAAVVAVTLLSGYVHGRFYNRWGIPGDMKAKVPMVDALKQRLKTEGFGDWKMVEDLPMTDVVRNTLEIPTVGKPEDRKSDQEETFPKHNPNLLYGYINGVFRNDNGEVVRGFLVLGPPGPISVHTPEVCYSSQAYEIKEKRRRVRIFPESEASDEEEAAPREDEFWALTMRSNDLDADILRVYYAWTNTGNWSAVYSPRVSFGGDPMLFKMQLAANLPPDRNLEEGDTCRAFLQALLPVVEEVLFENDS